MLEIRESDLDTEFIKHPTATYDLRSGAKMEHKPEHFITKETAVEREQPVWMNGKMPLTPFLEGQTVD